MKTAGGGPCVLSVVLCAKMYCGIYASRKYGEYAVWYCHLSLRGDSNGWERKLRTTEFEMTNVGIQKWYSIPRNGFDMRTDLQLHLLCSVEQGSTAWVYQSL